MSVCMSSQTWHPSKGGEKISLKKKESPPLSHQYNDKFAQFTFSSLTCRPSLLPPTPLPSLYSWGERTVTQDSICNSCDIFVRMSIDIKIAVSILLYIWCPSFHCGGTPYSDIFMSHLFSQNGFHGWERTRFKCDSRITIFYLLRNDFLFLLKNGIQKLGLYFTNNLS